MTILFELETLDEADIIRVLRAEVKLPAEEVDRYQRPGFITLNDAGIEVCENRLSCRLRPQSVFASNPPAHPFPPSRSSCKGSRAS